MDRSAAPYVSSSAVSPARRASSTWPERSTSRSGIGVVLCASQRIRPRSRPRWRRAWQARPNAERRLDPRDGPREVALQLYSHAAVFCCPSVYEPFGIINLEAVAGETPVVARWAGSPKLSSTAKRASSSRWSCDRTIRCRRGDPDRFELNLAGAINALMADAATREVMGRAARRRAVERFSWGRIAAATVDLYRTLVR